MQTLDPQSTSFQHQIQQQVAKALAEDIGVADFTAELSNPQTMGQATIVARESAVICGIPWVNQVFQQLSTDVVLDWQCQEGDQVNAGQVILKLHGPARAMLTGERTALNFLQTLSAVATLTKRYVELLQGTNACIMDTRKTIPGMRLAQKYAVRVGGGTNRDTRPLALSLSSPVGSPPAPRSITPCAGSVVAAVTRARRSATLLASD